MKLTPEQQVWIVSQLAVFQTQTEVAKAFEERYGVPIERRQVEQYDASKDRLKGHIRKELVDLFNETRDTFKADHYATAVANKSVRFREIQNVIEQEKRKPKPNRQIILQALEQAAKEEGGLYTNRRDLTSGGQPVKALIGVDIDAI